MESPYKNVMIQRVKLRHLGKFDDMKKVERIEKRTLEKNQAKFAEFDYELLKSKKLPILPPRYDAQIIKKATPASRREFIVSEIHSVIL